MDLEERFCQVGEVRLCYETFGEREAPPILLVMGLGTQMVAWHEDFCRTLADRGFHVIRFDNRDVGRSTRFDHVRTPTAMELLRRRRRGAAYTLSDMARDAARLLEELGHESAHIVGASMGGMIAQTVAAEHPDRVRSLVSIMSTTGSRWAGQPALRLFPVLLRRPPGGREAFVEHMVWVFRLIGSPGFPRDDDRIRELAGQSYDRGHDPAGAGRQLQAILASGNRTSRLGRIRAPALVIHGSADRLVRPSGGRATARAIPGARLLMIEGMGHDLPRGAWPQIIDGIVETAGQVQVPDRPDRSLAPV